MSREAHIFSSKEAYFEIGILQFTLNQYKPLNNLVSYSGIIPRVKQTGGSEGKTYTGKVAKRCNHILKDYVVQSGNHMGLHGPEELMADYKRREAAEQHADFGIGRRYLRTAMCLMRTSQIYMPEHLRNTKVEPEERTELNLFAYGFRGFGGLDGY